MFWRDSLMSDMKILLRGALAATAGALTAPAVLASVGSARAAAPMMGTAAPAFHRFKLGAFELTAIRDGADPRSGRLAHDDKVNRAEEPHPINATASLTKTPPSGVDLAIYRR